MDYATEKENEKKLEILELRLKEYRLAAISLIATQNVPERPSKSREDEYEKALEEERAFKRNVKPIRKPYRQHTHFTLPLALQSLN